jgi:hypothetical protein
VPPQGMIKRQMFGCANYDQRLKQTCLREIRIKHAYKSFGL